MTAKQIIFHEQVWGKMRAGIDALVGAVRVTLGPKARTVLLDRAYGAPTIINSGVLVAKEIELPDRLENMCAQMVREVASKTSDVAGDGTTTAMLLAHGIVVEGLKYVASGMNPMDLKRGIDKAVIAVIEELHRLAKPCASRNEIAQVATISANTDRAIGELIANAMEKVGKEGVITIEEASGLVNELEIVEGMQFDRGFLSPYFINDADKQRVLLEDVYVLIHDKKISSINDLLPVLEAVAKAGKPLLVVAEEVEGEALATLVVNNLRGVVKSLRGEGAGVRRPSQGHARRHRRSDRRACDCRRGRLDARPCRARRSRSRQAHRNRQGRYDHHRRRRRPRKDRRARRRDPAANQGRHQRLRPRKAAGARRQTGRWRRRGQGRRRDRDRNERETGARRGCRCTRRTRRSRKACCRAVAWRCCGRARRLAGLRGENPDQDAGIRIVMRALEEPLRQIVSNAGEEPSVVVDRVKEGSGGFGFNALTNQYGDMVEMGILDPCKVTRTALQNAASVAGLMLTTDCMIAQMPETDGAPDSPPMDM